MAEHPFDLGGKVALITGGNSGIGLSAAEALAAAGATVAIWGRRANRNQLASEQLRSLGATAFSDTVDVADPDQVERGFGRVVDELGRVDCVFLNAGRRSHRATFLDITPDDRRALLDTNLHGAWDTATCAVRHMTERADAGDAGGSIIVNGSLTVFGGLPGGQHYGAAKSSLVALTRGLAVEYGPRGIRTNMICPGFIEREGPPGRFTEELSRRGPTPRYGRPDEIGGIIVYLASDAASYHNGDVITIDGGWRASV